MCVWGGGVDVGVSVWDVDVYVCARHSAGVCVCVGGGGVVDVGVSVWGVDVYVCARGRGRGVRMYGVGARTRD